jgi:hypothetical protein
MASFRNKSSNRGDSFPSFTTTKNLCTPAFIYFTLSILGLLMVLLQNIGNQGIYSLGTFSVDVHNVALIFIMKFVYILFWTWILNLICRDGYSNVAWALVLLPFILVLFIMIMPSSDSIYEGLSNSKRRQNRKEREAQRKKDRKK